MRVSKYLSDFLCLGIIGLGLSGAYLVSRKVEKPSLNISKQQTGFNINENFFRYFHVGQKRLYSSLFWVATILESDHDHYKGKDLNSWMYLRFLTISNLEPKFLMTYTFGGPYLSIIKDDLEGASEIYERGLKIYPNDYSLLSNAAFHFQFEKIDYKKSYDIYKRVNQFSRKKTQDITQLARIESDNGNHLQAYELLINLYQQQQDKNSILAKKIWEFLYAIKAEMDLKCLNSDEENSRCSKNDLDNNPYIKSESKYKARKDWIPFGTRGSK